MEEQYGIDDIDGGSMKKHVLVVDDEIGALTLIGIMLERGGFGVLKAKDARSALQVLDETTPDLIILDVMMPGMDGIELCGVIRKRDTTHKTPVLILSARGDAESIIRGIEAGANDYLPKPILHHDLVSKVRSMLGQSANEF
jgi:DNA-binding response OmpR family regulator